MNFGFDLWLMIGFGAIHILDLDFVGGDAGVVGLSRGRFASVNGFELRISFLSWSLSLASVDDLVLGVNPQRRLEDASILAL